MSPLVTHEAGAPGKALSTLVAFIRSLSGMGSQVTNPIGAVRETVPTLVAGVGLLSRVNSLMPD